MQHGNYLISQYKKPQTYRFSYAEFWKLCAGLLLRLYTYGLVTKWLLLPKTVQLVKSKKISKERMLSLDRFETKVNEKVLRVCNFNVLLHYAAKLIKFKGNSFTTLWKMTQVIGSVWVWFKNCFLNCKRLRLIDTSVKTALSRLKKFMSFWAKFGL